MSLLTNDHPICKRKGCESPVAIGARGRLLRLCEYHRVYKLEKARKPIMNKVTYATPRTLLQYTEDKFIRQFNRVVEEMF